jgi:GNAT superfamily N-acetyltransferase
VGVAIERLVGPLNAADVDALAKLLLDAVAGNASIGFPADTTQGEAQSFWKGIEADMAARRAVVLGARLEGKLIATGQLRFSSFPNSQHRAEVAKLLVHSSVRRQGMATNLMAGLEAAAREVKRTLLILDTEAGSGAERMYEKLGWTKAGVIPDFAYRPDGRLRPSAFFYKALV